MKKNGRRHGLLVRCTAAATASELPALSLACLHGELWHRHRREHHVRERAPVPTPRADQLRALLRQVDHHADTRGDVTELPIRRETGKRVMTLTANDPHLARLPLPARRGLGHEGSLSVTVTTPSPLRCVTVPISTWSS